MHLETVSVVIVVWFVVLRLSQVTFCSCLSLNRPMHNLECTNNKRLTMTSTCDGNRFTTKELPNKLIVGYANWNQCDDSLIHAVEQGVNVLIWFSINLAVDEHGLPAITNGPDMDCVAEKVRIMAEKGLDVIHLISIGGWNSPHPDTRNSPEDTFVHWDRWNREVVPRPEMGFYGFDGLDWDIEGNDTPSSPYNQFTVEALDLMGKFSQLAKTKGYIVAMAPAESYLDPSCNSFDRSLLHEYEEWKGVIPPFAYHGRNTYAYLLSRYGHYLHPERGVDEETFDFVTIQLYEGYSHAQFKTFIENKPADEVLVDFVKAVTQGWDIDFSPDADLQYPHSITIRVAKSKLVLGLANGWAGDGKFLLVLPTDIEKAYKALDAEGLTPRGCAFWNILDEGRAPPCDPSRPLWLAKALNEIMHIRD